jgi:hypothetical protein
MAIGDATLATLVNILKTQYEPKLGIAFYKKAPLAAQMRKENDFGGNNNRISLRFGAPQGGSFQFTVAQANASPSSDVGFMLTPSNDYQVSGIAGQAIAMGDGSEKTIYNALKGEQEGSMRNITRSLQIAMWRNGGGARSQGNSSYTITGKVATLAQSADIVGFEVGMRCDFSADDGYNNGGTLGGVRKGGPLTVVAVDRVAGTVTFDQAISPTLQGVTNADYIFRQGDYGLGCAGVGKWLPSTAPTTGDSFFGVDRSVDATRLGGLRYKGNGGNKEETLVDAAELASREGAEDLAGFVNNLDRADIIKSMGTRVRYDSSKSSEGDIGFRSVNIDGPDGDIPIYSDINVPRGTFFLLSMGDWSLKSAGGVPRLLDFDGNKMIREANNDGYQWRMGGYFQVGCDAPGESMQGTW